MVLAIYELKFSNDTPVNVVINEAVDFCECCGLRISIESIDDAKTESTVASSTSVISAPEINNIPAVKGKDHDVTPQKSMKAYFKKPGNL